MLQNSLLHMSLNKTEILIFYFYLCLSLFPKAAVYSFIDGNVPLVLIYKRYALVHIGLFDMMSC